MPTPAPTIVPTPFPTPAPTSVVPVPVIKVTPSTGLVAGDWVQIAVAVLIFFTLLWAVMEPWRARRRESRAAADRLRVRLLNMLHDFNDLGYDRAIFDTIARHHRDWHLNFGIEKQPLRNRPAEARLDWFANRLACAAGKSADVAHWTKHDIVEEIKLLVQELQAYDRWRLRDWRPRRRSPFARVDDLDDACPDGYPRHKFIEDIRAALIEADEKTDRERQRQRDG